MWSLESRRLSIEFAPCTKQWLPNQRLNAQTSTSGAERCIHRQSALTSNNAVSGASFRLLVRILLAILNPDWISGCRRAHSASVVHFRWLTVVFLGHRNDLVTLVSEPMQYAPKVLTQMSPWMPPRCLVITPVANRAQSGGIGRNGNARHRRVVAEEHWAYQHRPWSAVVPRQVARVVTAPDFQCRLPPALALVRGSPDESHNHAVSLREYQSDHRRAARLTIASIACPRRRLPLNVSSSP